MKSVVVLVVLAACTQTCLALPAAAPSAAPVPVPAGVPSAGVPAAPAVPKPEEAVKTEVAASPAVPAVPVQAETTAAPTQPAAPPPTTAAPAAADSANKMGHLMAAPALPALPALNSTKGAISVQVLPPLLPKCSADAECVALLGPHSACRDYWCECADGAKYESGFSKRCLRDVAAIGDSCKEAGDCRRIANAYCKAGSCHCNRDFVFSNSGKACLRVATPADASCTEDRQCVRLLNSVAAPEGPAVCVAGQCKCRYDHVLENGTCVHKQARGKSCTADAECADLDGGACIQGVCGCKQEYVPAVAANKCLPVLHELGAACSEDIQCSEGLGDLGHCVLDKCACPDGAAVSADTKKCACAEGEVLDKAANRCEKAAPQTAPQAQQQPIKEGSAMRKSNNDNGAAGSLQASMTVVTLLVCAAYSAL